MPTDHLKHNRTMIVHSLYGFVYCFCVFIFAILLTFLEDFCVESKRPMWLIWGIRGISIFAFIADGVAFVSTTLTFTSECVRTIPWRRK